ncbi:hypothetical protein TEA_014645 [Camellia sinensis var. sinensis]|uniref:Trichome birefringence-like C-terminal domain-containing protein n=1 Tax=Camellia sinensis var. sinensis TaxID=542762 RepID=A0A4S4D878_CAMSN|nr:hypothetical protein TEA_014645 [Camellia sinensis var. sinensis]
MLYWVSHEINAYHLDKRTLFSGPIEDLQIEHHLRCGDYLFTSSLLHLAQDRFCLLWVAPDESLYRLHCTILQVSKSTDLNGKGCLSASVLSCQSFIVEFPLDFLDGLLPTLNTSVFHNSESLVEPRALFLDVMASMAILLGSGKRKARTKIARTEIGRVGPKISESSSSASPLLRRHVQSVCFRGRLLENNMTEWFHFTMAGSDSNKKKERRRRCRRGQVNLVFHHNHRHKGEGERSRLLSPIQVQPDSSDGSSSAALGSIIYCIGGRCFRNCDDDDGHTRRVQYFDVNRPTEGWKEASPMINPRSEAKVVALNGKLYAFGGCSPPDCGDWAEVFEPCGPDDDGGQGHKQHKSPEIENHARHWTDADILVFNSYIWWRKPKLKALWGSFDGVYKEVNMPRGYEMALKTWLDGLDIYLNRTRTKLYFVSNSPTHERGEKWGRSSDENCYNEKEPILEEGYEGSESDPEMMQKVEAAINELSRRGLKVQLLNITRLSEYRKDGHTSIYRKQWRRVTRQQLANPSSYADCVNWCNPGVPDVWNELLYAYMFYF